MLIRPGTIARAASLTLSLTAMTAWVAPETVAASVSVLDQTKIADGAGGFPAVLHDEDWFGFSVDSLGDFDHDGVGDLVVGAGFDDDGGLERGAVWVVLLHGDGTVKSSQKISSTSGGFTGPIRNGDVFGRSVANIGDLDGDGVTDIAVGARQDDDGGHDRGAVWILFLNPSGTVKTQAKISSTNGGLSDPLTDNGWFGISVSRIGDLDHDGNSELVVGQIFDSGGAVWILFLNADGTVKQSRRIRGSDFGATNLFGESVSGIGDLDGDGVEDVAATELEDSDGGSEKGAAWILFLNADGTRKDVRKISATAGGFTGSLNLYDHFGAAVAGVGDLDGDGVRDIAVGSDLDDDGGQNRGAVWLLFLHPDGTVKSHTKVSQTGGGFGGTLEDEDRFGRSVASLGDIDGDTRTDLAIGTIFDDGNGVNRGAVWITHLDGAPTGPTTTTTTMPPLCGDGVPGGSEECDDGNVLSGDGCSDSCLCEPAVDADGDSLADPCDACPLDPANDADGDGLCAETDPCPADTENDIDNDGTCADVDNCPAVANADQADSDLDERGDACDSCPGTDDREDQDNDGIGDGCDPCTNIDGERDIAIKATGWFRQIRLHGANGNETFDFTGEFFLPEITGFAAVQPLVHPVRIRVERSDGVPVIDVTLPTSVASAGTGSAWMTNALNTRWSFLDRNENPPGGIMRVRLDDRSILGAGRTRVFIRGRDGFYDIPFGTEPYRVIVVVGDPVAGECGETRFTATECAFFKGHVSLLCERR